MYKCNITTDIFWLHTYLCLTWCLLRLSLSFSSINLLLVSSKTDEAWGAVRGGIRGSEAMGWLGRCRDELFSDCLTEPAVDCLLLELVLAEGEWWRWGLDSREGLRWACSPSSIHCKMRLRLTGRKGMLSSLRVGRTSQTLPSLPGSIGCGSTAISFNSGAGGFALGICWGWLRRLYDSRATGAAEVVDPELSTPATGFSFW